ncbi:MAG: putative phage abortive infection protein, partial [Fibrobacteraceae bacterium]|nr:putative phage abortive infection protein [Fibrobacteraceae bacterium]
MMSFQDLLLFALYIPFFLIWIIPVLILKPHFKKISINKFWESNQRKIIFLLILLAAGFILFSFFAPHLFDTEKNVESMSPFIAVSAAILTFLAFLIQYQTNQHLIQDNKKQQAERQFYEMLKIHNENVKNLRAETEIAYNNIKSSHYSIYGQDFIRALLEEFNYIYEIVEKHHKFISKLELLKKSYYIFFYGQDVAHRDGEINDTINNELNGIKCDKKTITITNSKLIPLINTLFQGRVDQLNSYYRHLFLLVKSIVYADNDLFSYSDKRQYLRIVRAQLTSAEQVLLFYNWISDLGGGKWEESENEDAIKSQTKKNHFFTDYRMIHNINPKDCIAFSPEDILHELQERNRHYKKLDNNDSLFEIIKEKIEGSKF